MPQPQSQIVELNAEEHDALAWFRVIMLASGKNMLSVQPDDVKAFAEKHSMDTAHLAKLCNMAADIMTKRSMFQMKVV